MSETQSQNRRTATARRALALGVALTLTFAATAPVTSGSANARARVERESPPSSPRGSVSTRIVRLRRPGGFAGIFNLGRGAVRVVAVTDGDAASDPVVLEAVGRLLAATPSKRLRAYVVMPEPDSSSSTLHALSRLRSLTDRRVVAFLDGTGELVGACRAALGAGASCGLLLYAPQAVFSVEANFAAHRALGYDRSNSAWTAGVDSMAADIARMLAVFGERRPIPVDSSATHPAPR